MNVEEKVREALQRAGHERHVDVQALHDSTRRMLLQGRTQRRTGSWRPIALGAAAAAVVIGGVVAVPSLDLPDLPGLGPDPAGAPDGDVDNGFSCPVQAKARFNPDQDDSFLPQLTDDLQPAGEAAGAPRWETEPTDVGAVLRLGNADGTLASITEFERSEGRLRPSLITKCVNNRSPQAALVQDGLPPEGENAFGEGSLATGAQRIVDRLTYDVRGLAKRWPVWAEPCGGTICLIAGTTQASLRGELEPEVPEDATSFLASPDDMVGQDTGLRLVMVYDRDDSLDSVDWISHSGQGHNAKAIGGGWDGKLFVFIAADSDLAEMHLHPERDGGDMVYTRDEFLE